MFFWQKMQYNCSKEYNLARTPQGNEDNYH